MAEKSNGKTLIGLIITLVIGSYAYTAWSIWRLEERLVKHETRYQSMELVVQSIGDEQKRRTEIFGEIKDILKEIREKRK